MKRLLITLSCALLAASVTAKVKLPSVISDNMVLQQQSEAALWGWGRPGGTIRVTSSWGKSASARIGSDGKWTVRLHTPQASYKPQTLTFSDGDKVTVKGVLIGEVWIASGQSNMQMQMNSGGSSPVEESLDEIINSTRYANSIREFKVPLHGEYEPQEDTPGEWKAPSLQNTPSFSAVGWFFARYMQQALDVPVGILLTAYGGSMIEAWMTPEVLSKYPGKNFDRTSQDKLDVQKRNSVLFNAMLNPLIPYTIKGFIWYQGEENVRDHRNYTNLMTDMVELWRKEFGQGDLPFYYVEIAPCSYRHAYGTAPYLREAQFKAQARIPNSLMICTNDLVEDYEVNNIHPRHKRQVGLRLACAALNLTHGMTALPCKSPTYKEMKIEDDKILLYFNDVEGNFGIVPEIKGFEIAGEDRVFYPAKASVRKKVVTVWSDEVRRPVAVRYCFKDFQVGNMSAQADLPLVPFRTDDW